VTDPLPTYAELPVVAGAPPGSSWGVWGEDDKFGTLNLQTPERARRAAESVRSGRWFALNLPFELPDPPLYNRARVRHEVTGELGGGHDDLLHDWNTQSSTQWDGFRHFAHRSHGHYGGVADQDHGMHFWAERGIVARAVLADVDRWRAAQGRPLRQGESDPITGPEVLACLEAQGTTVEVGDVLLVRTGWTTWYRTLDADARVAHAADLHTPGLAGRELPEVLWDLHVSALALDNPGVDMWPPGPETGFFHLAALPLLGLPLGELWDLDGLADDCRSTGTYDSLLTSAPINVHAGVASPANAIAIR
jgi:hypothetical protein